MMNFVFLFMYVRMGVFFDEGFCGDVCVLVVLWVFVCGVVVCFLDIDIGDSLGVVVVLMMCEWW